MLDAIFRIKILGYSMESEIQIFNSFLIGSFSMFTAPIYVWNNSKFPKDLLHNFLVSFCLAFPDDCLYRVKE